MWHGFTYLRRRDSDLDGRPNAADPAVRNGALRMVQGDMHPAPRAHLLLFLYLQHVQC